MPPSPSDAPGAIPPRGGPADSALGGISLVFPVYNESLIIEQTLRTSLAEVVPLVPDLEVLVAEDGSTDHTTTILTRLAHELPIKVLSSDERKGH